MLAGVGVLGYTLLCWLTVYTAVDLRVPALPYCVLSGISPMESLVGEFYPIVTFNPRSESDRPKRSHRYGWLGRKSPRPSRGKWRAGFTFLVPPICLLVSRDLVGRKATLSLVQVDLD